MFILNYECLKDFIISVPRDFYGNLDFSSDEVVFVETEEYKNNVRSLHKNIEDASLLWLRNAEAITEKDICTYHMIRKRRNELVHKFMTNLNNGFVEKDIELFLQVLKLYSKVDKWWINKIEIPTSSDKIPEDYNRDEVLGGQALLLTIINDLCLDINVTEYSEILDELRKGKISFDGKK